MKMRTALMLLIGVLSILIVYRFCVPMQPSVSKTMPQASHGTWVTNHEDYSSRYLKITAESITFGTGGVTGKRFRVTAYNEELEEGGVQVNTVYYRDVDGSRYSREFYLQSAGRGQLVFKNQPEVIWTRQQ